MRWTRRWRKRLRALIHRDAVERELDEELAYHLELETEKNVRQGMSRAEARRQAAIAFGGIEKSKEEVRDARHFGWVPRMSLDFKLGLRMLFRYPGLTLVGGLAMAFAIGVGAAAFLYGARLFFPPLPFADAGRVVVMRYIDQENARTDLPRLYDLGNWRERLRTIEEVGAYSMSLRGLETESGVTPVAVGRISASAFRIAEVPPLVGRPLQDDDERIDGPFVAVIGEDVWELLFGRDPGVVGRTVTLGGSPATIVGVMPVEFGIPAWGRVWTPLRFDPSVLGPGAGPSVTVFGRLSSGASLEAAQAELTAVGVDLEAEYPDNYSRLRPEVISFARANALLIPDALAVAASVNLLGVVFVLLICGNVGLLMFARTATRENEIVVRTALGASRGRIVGQLFAESLVLAILATVLGVGAASYGMVWITNAIVRLVGPDAILFTAIYRAEPATVIYGALVALLAAFVIGVLPALRVMGSRLGSKLRHGSTGGGPTRQGRVWMAIIVIQVALTILLPMIGYIVNREFNRTGSADLGFRQEEYLTAALQVDSGDPLAATPTFESETASERPAAIYEEFKRRLEAEPGVAGVTFTARLPKHAHEWARIEVDDATNPSPGSWTERRVRVGSVDLDYFSVFGAEIVSGRGFQPADLAPGRNFVVVNTSFVDEVMGGRNPVGRYLRYPVAPDPATTTGSSVAATTWYEIVGVVETVSMSGGIDGDLGFYELVPPGGPRFNGPNPQLLPGWSPMPIAIRVSGDPDAVASRLRAVAREVSPSLQVTSILPMDEVVNLDVRMMTLASRAAYGVGAIAMFLALAGIHSVMSLAVTQRTREIGIRLALGAGSHRLLREIFRGPFAQIGIGVLLGAGILSVLMTGILSEGAPPGRTVTIFAAHVIVTAGVCLLACVVPARRAMRIEPTEAMRADV